jgi:uncharacterized lipoprotein YmbA
MSLTGKTSWLFLLALLVGCASAPGIPETTYFRLPERAGATPLAETLFDEPISVDTFIADGLYSDQALIYSLTPDGSRLRGYHYQLWIDPPVRMLQRRVIAALREANVSSLVADRLPSKTGKVRISGRIDRFERIRSGDDWSVAVALQLRVDRTDLQQPLMIREYTEILPAAGASVNDSVDAIGRALDRIEAAFIADLQAATGN